MSECPLHVNPNTCVFVFPLALEQESSDYWQPPASPAGLCIELYNDTQQRETLSMCVITACIQS